MDFTKRRIPLPHIRSEDETFRISTHTKVEALSRSITSSGLINLPILKKNKSHYIIVSGFQRTQACRELGWTDIDSRIVDPGTPYRSCVELAISDNTFHRELNPIELSRAFQLLISAYGDLNQVAEISSVLGLPTNIRFIQQVKDICLLPDSVQKGIESGAIAIAIALKLKEMTPAESENFASIFSALNLSLNKQRELLTFIQEIALRDKITLLSVLLDPVIQGIIGAKNIDRNDKTRQVRTVIRIKRFPEMSKKEKLRQKQIQGLGLGRGISFIPPRYFEDTTFAIRMQFRNRSELKAQSQNLAKILENPLIKDIVCS